MMNRLVLRLGALLPALCLFDGSAGAAEPEIIARARSFVGTEEALAGVTSVQYVGTLETTDPADPAKKSRAKIEIVFQKPEQQRIAATSEKMVEVTALDGYEGWQRVEDPKDVTKWRQVLLTKEQIKRLRANTWENLAYFRGIERVGGRLEDQGTATIDGVTCQKIAFIHQPNIVFIRYFDVATGRLVFTETEAGGTIREQGEMIVQGIRFPRSIVTTSKDPKGQVVTVTITFEKITLNESFPAKVFAVPALGRAR
jgi:outer membrane lipoprotein-sorting protein